MASLTPGPRAAAKVEAALRRYVGPMMRAGAGLDPSAMTVDQMRAAFAGDSPEAARNLAALASKLSVSPATALRFANDYIDTFGAIALYEQSVERLMPAVVELVKEMKRLLAKPATKSNPILRTALDDIIVILPDLVTSVRKRLGSVEKIAVALWTGSGGGPFVQQAQVREFQVLIGFLLAGVSAKVTSWRIAFPAGTAVNSAKRATFFGSEMNHAMQQLRDAAQRGTRAASFPSDVLRIRDKGDNFRAFLRARQPQR